MENLREFVKSLSALFPEKGKYLIEQIDEIQNEIENLKSCVKKLKAEITKFEQPKVS